MTRKSAARGVATRGACGVSPTSADPTFGSGQNTADGASAEILDALRSTQTKLAQEQARYEIAFRQDLAALADQLRRSR